MDRRSLFLVVFAAFGWVSCNSSSTTSTCSGQGFFADRDSCVAASGKPCVLTTAQPAAGSKSAVCWKPDASLGVNSTPSPSPTPTPVASPKDSCWEVGEWYPATCDGSAAILSRVVLCKCALCEAVAPEQTKPCKPDLFNRIHYTFECQSLGGAVQVSPRGDKYCSLAGSFCPKDWSPYAPDGLPYTATAPGEAYAAVGNKSKSKITTPWHKIGPAPVEFLNYCEEMNRLKSCTRQSTVHATVVRVGCF